MRIVVRLFFGAVAGTLLLLAFAGNANAQYTSSVGLKPSSGKAGSSFTISWNFYPCKGPVTFSWNGTPMWSANADLQNISGTVAATVPAGAQPGTYPVTGTCTNARTGGPLSAGSRFTVTATPTTTPPPPPVTTTPPPPPVTTRPSKPGAPTTPSVPTTTPPTTTSTPPTTTTPATPGTPATTSSTEPKPGELVLDRPSVKPGEPLSASGKGCVPGRMVTLTSDGADVGSAFSDSSGAFTAPVEFTRIEAGRHTVIAECGVRLTGAVDQVVTRSSGGQTGTLVILVFFVLAGVTVIRFR
ncbi:hypothetical protein [Amycolatopsis vastitatis]|nr:hypothetical protein [Amycolatopsis vastitatis]